MVVAVEVGEQGFQRRLVVGDQSALHLSFGGVGEDVEGGAAQGFEAGEDAEDVHHPGAELPFAQGAGERVAVAEDRRGQVEGEGEVAVELVAEGLFEPAVGVEPGDLVFVLGGEQLEIRAGDRLGEVGAAGHAFGLGLAHFVDERGVAGGIGRIPVGGEFLDAPGDDVVEGLGAAVGGGGVDAGGAFDRGPVVGGAAAPEERLFVEVDRGGVDLDRPFDRLRRDRQQSLLVGEADHEQVDGDGVA